MRVWITASVTLFLASSGLFAQSAATSQISGTVRDASGLAVPGAQVKAVQTETGVTRSADTGADGAYTLPALPTGPYRLEVSKQGFNTYVQNGVVLQVASNPEINVSLQVGNVTQQIVVEASASMVETRSSGVGQVVDQQRIVDLPLNGRVATDLIYMAGAAAQAPNADLVSAKNYPNEAPISIAGGLAAGTLYMLDGGTHNDPLNNLNLPLPFPDALQEFKVETSALPAQYGQHSGGAVNAITKSGTDQFHGDAFEFVRNYIFNARNELALTRDSLKRNQFGGTLGGPIRKDKLFFFLGYQGTIIRSNPNSTFAFVPTPAMYTGDFSTEESGTCQAKPIQLKNPVTGAPFAGNQVPVSMFSPQALKMLSYFPGSADPCGRVQFGILQNQTENTGLARVDYQYSQSQTFFLRYFVTHSLQPPTFDGKDPLTETLAGANDMVNSAVIGHTWIISPSMVNSFRGTFNRSSVSKFDTPSFDGPSLGIAMTTLVPGHLVATVSGNGGLYSSSVFSYASLDPTYDYQLNDDFSWIKGNHQIQIGGDWIYSLQNVYGPLLGDGDFSFTGSQTGSPIADLFLGDAATYSQQNLQFDDERYTYFGAYVQDAWKATPHVTVNAGLRWEPYFGGRMTTNEVTHFSQADFNANLHSTIYPNAPAGLLFPGDSGFNTGGRPNNTVWNDFAPRLGVVWDPRGDGKMTIRASWGMFYDLPHTLFAYGFVEEPPWGESIARTVVPFGNPWLGYPGGNPFPITLNSSFNFPNFGSYANYPLNLQPTYLEQWNLSVQRQIGANWLASATYLGNNTIHLWGNNPINAPENLGTGPCTLNGVAYPVCDTAANENQRRPLYLQNPSQGQYYGAIYQLDNGGTASYNAMLLSMQHRLADHFTVLANYTYSHCISDLFTSELDSTASQYTVPGNRRNDRGNCIGIDHRQIFNLSMLAEAPTFSRQWVERVAGHWKLSSSLQFQTGSYYSVTAGSDVALTGITTARANQVLPNPYCAVQTPTCWLNPAAFATPALNTVGNVGAASIAGPSTLNLTLGLFRDFRVREKQALEVRWEVFNALNNFRPGNPLAGVSTTTLATALNSSTFGQVQIAADPRIMQFALKYIF
jgi:hypothetical protein